MNESHFHIYLDKNLDLTDLLLLAISRRQRLSKIVHMFHLCLFDFHALNDLFLMVQALLPLHVCFVSANLQQLMNLARMYTLTKGILDCTMSSSFELSFTFKKAAKRTLQTKDKKVCIILACTMQTHTKASNDHEMSEFHYETLILLTFTLKKHKIECAMLSLCRCQPDKIYSKDVLIIKCI